MGIVALVMALGSLLALLIARRRPGELHLASPAVLALGVLAIGLMLWRDRRHADTRLALPFVLTVHAVVLAQIWFGRGLQGSTMLALPGILVLAGAFCSGRQFAGLTGLNLVAVVLIFVLHPSETSAPDLAWLRLLASLLLLGGTALMVGIVSRDFKRQVAATQREVLAARQAQALAEHRGAHDALTGLLNRNQGQRQGEALLAVAAAQQTRCAVLHVDLREFRFVNDSLGPEAGDQVLQRAAAALRDVLDETTPLVRFGSDEFLAVFNTTGGDQALTQLAQGLLARLAMPWSFHGMEICSEASIGIAVFPEDGGNLQRLIRQAQAANRVARQAVGQGSGPAYRLADAARHRAGGEPLGPAP